MMKTRTNSSDPALWLSLALWQGALASLGWCQETPAFAPIISTMARPRRMSGPGRRALMAAPSRIAAGATWFPVRMVLRGPREYGWAIARRIEST